MLFGKARRNARSVCAPIALTTLAALASFAPVSFAQTLPGIVVMTAPPQMPQGQPPMQPPQMMQPPPGMIPQPPRAAPPAAAAAKPKPKPKPAVQAASADAEAGANGGPGRGSGGGTNIAVLVNGEPITNYEIDQRAALLGLQSDIGSRAMESMKKLATSEGVNSRWKQIVEDTIQANQGKTREQIIAIVQEKQKAFTMGLQKQAVEGARASVLPGLRNKAKEELIEEQIKLQEAKKIGASADEAMIDTIVKDIAGRNKLTPQQFAEHFGKQGVDISTFKAKFRAQQAWAEAVRRKFGHLVNPNNRDIDKLMQTTGAGEDLVELQLQRIVVPIPAKLDQRVMAQRMVDAEQLHQQFAGCKTAAGLAGKLEGARFENMGTRKANNFTEPTRTLLLNAKDEEMIPPSVTTTGIELIAVCGRKVIKATEEQRNEKASVIRQEEFERISKKHLRDVKADAVIEHR
jgi:peptidyl-prolyl cis-trans isomerase SurA